MIITCIGSLVRSLVVVRRSQAEAAAAAPADGVLIAAAA